MKISIESLSIRNFKGVSALDIAGTQVINVYGRNGSGKTSIFDAFTWLLFGKLHDETKNDEGLKPVGRSKTDVEVSAVLELDEDRAGSVQNKDYLSLKRIYKEEWANNQLKGHTTDYFINDVPVKMKDYNQKVDEICAFDVFKAITNPHYFPSLHPAEQRKMLFEMVPEISFSDVAGKDKDYLNLLYVLNGKSLADFKKELAVKKSKIQAELSRLPVAIEENNRNMPEALDWKELEADLAAKKAELEEITGQIADTSKLSEADTTKRWKIQQQIQDLYAVQDKLERQAKLHRDETLERKRSEIRQVTMEIGDAERDYNNKKAKIEALAIEMEVHTKRIEALRSEWKQINERTLVFNEADFACPTCKRPFEPEDVFGKKQEMLENFQAKKAADLEENRKAGLAVKAKILAIEEEKKAIALPEKPDTEDLKKRIEEMRAFLNELEASPFTAKDSVEWKAAQQQIDVLLKQKEETGGNNDATEPLKEKKAELERNISTLERSLFTKTEIDKLEKRIAELEGQATTLNQDLADIEAIEDIAQRFELERNSQYERAVNRLFQAVRFRLFDEQLNGNTKSTCECTMNNVPYATLSNAQQVYAGLDIIKAISRHHNVYAPIFIDNRESITEIPDMDCQIINLYVSNEANTLIITP